jgi:NADPH:quinone reductase-like Zn-dependent oxidoreductase
MPEMDIEDGRNMKAVVCTGYGPVEVLQLREVEKPIQKDNEVCINIHATAVTASDVIVRGFKLPLWHPIGLMMGIVVGFRKPRKDILGMVLSGTVEEVGQSVTRFQPGDRVYGFSGTNFGTYAEYICLPESSQRGFPGTVPSALGRKPSQLSDDEAAALPYGFGMALHYLRKGNVQSGQHVLIYGASGAIGTMAVQLAKYFGAKVSAVCSTRSLELVQSLGADQVLDYTRQDAPPSGERYDLVLDAVGKAKTSEFKTRSKKALAPDGKYISVDDGSPQFREQDFPLLEELIQAGKVQPVIDCRFPLEDIAAAHRYVDQGHKKGNVVIMVAQENNVYKLED